MSRSRSGLSALLKVPVWLALLLTLTASKAALAAAVDDPGGEATRWFTPEGLAFANARQVAAEAYNGCLRAAIRDDNALSERDLRAICFDEEARYVRFVPAEWIDFGVRRITNPLSNDR